MKNPGDIPEIHVDVDEAPNPSTSNATMHVGYDANGNDVMMPITPYRPMSHEEALRVARRALDAARARRGGGGKTIGVAAILAKLARKERDPQISSAVAAENYLRNVIWPPQRPAKEDLIERIDRVVAESETVMAGIRFERHRQRSIDDLLRMFGGG